MLVSVIFSTSGASSFYLVSGNTWSDCTAWAESTEGSIQSISLQNQTLVLNNPSSDESYFVILKDDITNKLTNYIIYDTYRNIDVWIESQSDVSVQNISYQKKTYVQL